MASCHVGVKVNGQILGDYDDACSPAADTN